MNTNPLAEQHGGNHYKGQAIQPIEIAMANRYDACIFSALKYVSRHHLKNGREDLLKGQHFVYLRLATLVNPSLPARQHISIRYYCEKNELGPGETSICIMLHDWAAGNLPIGTDESTAAEYLSAMFDKLIDYHYPKG